MNTWNDPEDELPSAHERVSAIVEDEDEHVNVVMARCPFFNGSPKWELYNDDGEWMAADSPPIAWAALPRLRIALVKKAK